jgi:hypothetical protein
MGRKAKDRRGREGGRGGGGLLSTQSTSDPEVVKGMRESICRGKGTVSGLSGECPSGRARKGRRKHGGERMDVELREEASLLVSFSLLDV